MPIKQKNSTEELIAQLKDKQNIWILSGAGISASAPEKKVAPKAAEPAPAAAPTGTLKFMDAPDGEKDDLKKISGVGPVLEKALNGLGIYHFHQVAAFTAKDIEAVENETNFPGRIERDDWIAQAKTLAEG